VSSKVVPQLEQSVQNSPAFTRHVWVMAVFCVYAAVLLMMTHWPRLEVPGPTGTDKLLHILAFGGWCGLFTVCGWFGRPLSDANLLRSCVVAAAYGALDEGLQGLEWIQRSCEWADLGANLTGVVGVTTVLLILRAPLSRHFPRLLPT